MTIALRRFTRCLRVPSPDKNGEWAGSGIDRPRGRPVAFALPTAVDSHPRRRPDLLCSTCSSAVPEASDPMEEGRW